MFAKTNALSSEFFFGSPELTKDDKHDMRHVSSFIDKVRCKQWNQSWSDSNSTATILLMELLLVATV